MDFFEAFFANSCDIFPPAAKKTIFAFAKSKLASSKTSYCLSLNLIIEPTLFEDANKYKLSIGSFFFF